MMRKFPIAGTTAREHESNYERSFAFLFRKSSSKSLPTDYTSILKTRFSPTNSAFFVLIMDTSIVL